MELAETLWRVADERPSARLQLSHPRPRCRLLAEHRTRCRPGGVREHTCDVRCYTLVSIGGSGRSPVQPRFRLVEPNRSSSQVSSACFPGLLIRGMRFSSVAARAWSQGLLTSRSRFRLKLSRTGAHVARSGMFAALLRRLAATRTGAPRHRLAGPAFYRSLCRVSAALRRNQSSSSTIATHFRRPRRTHRSSGPMCSSKDFASAKRLSAFFYPANIRVRELDWSEHRPQIDSRADASQGIEGPYFHKTDIASTRRKKRPLSKLDMPRSRPRRRAKFPA